MINHVSKLLKVTYFELLKLKLTKLEFSGENGYLMGIKKDAVHVNTTTISPQAATQLEELHNRHNAHYVSGPVRIT